MTFRDDDSLMLAYVYDELSDDEARAFEQRLAEDAGLRAEVDGLLATREMLGEDARYGESSGLDLPPAHLKEAILRAEALARPSEIRQAHAAGEQGGFLARIQLWLVGGGLAVTAAAAFLFVAKDGASPEADMAAHAPSAVLAEPSAEVPADAKVAESAKPTAPAKGALAGNEFLDDDAHPAAAAPSEPAAKEEESAVGLLSAADAPERRAPMQKAEPDADEGGALPHSLDRLGAGDGEGFALEHDDVEHKSSAGSTAKSDSASKDKEVRTLAPSADLEDGVVGGAGFSGLARDEASPAPPAEAVAEEKPRMDSFDEAADVEAEAAPLSSGRRSLRDQGSASGSAGTGSVAQSAPSAAPRGPPPLPEVARRELAKKRAARTRAPSSDQASPSKATQNQRFDELQLALVTAERELSEGRALEALDMFTSVSRQDPRGALVGVVPYVGQMRALYALGRHAEVLALLPTVKRPGMKATGVPEGILTAARSAEALKRYALARELYRELVVVKERRQEAEAGLRRLDAEARVRAKTSSSDAAAEAADEPAAASEPRGKN